MPMGEMWDLERLSEICASTGRYSFFFTSWPINAYVIIHFLSELDDAC